MLWSDILSINDMILNLPAGLVLELLLVLERGCMTRLARMLAMNTGSMTRSATEIDDGPGEPEALQGRRGIDRPGPPIGAVSPSFRAAPSPRTVVGKCSPA